MRLDNFISDLGIVKRRTLAKELADGGHITINGNRAKPARKVKAGDIIDISGKYRVKIRVIKVPESGSVARAARGEYFEVLAKEASPDLDL